MMLPLALILFYIIKQGSAALDLNFFIQLPKPVGELGGGVANAILDTCQIVFLALFSIPIGLFTGVFTS